MSVFLSPLSCSGSTSGSPCLQQELVTPGSYVEKHTSITVEIEL